MGLPRRQPPHSNLRIALIQLCSTQDVPRNCARTLDQCREAAKRGAHWVLLPENACYIRREGGPISWCESLRGDVISSFRRLAGEHGIYLLLGSFPERIPECEKVYNTSVLFGPEGDIIASYRKLHLFDATLPDGRVLKESQSVKKGSELTVANVDGVRVGLSICYDLRFPEMYRALALAGAEVITVPSAFTVPTGQAHWETLLRARAIENQVFILAPAETGQHSPTRSSYGHSMIINPWGEVLASADEEETILESTLELDQVRLVRERMPCWQHRRFDIYGQCDA